MAVAALAATVAQADTIGVQLKGSYVETIQSGGATVPRADLRNGVSNGPILEHPWGTLIRSADSRNLESYFIRNNTSGVWEITFGAWTPGAGPAADFFLFDIGGNDSIQVKARFQNGALGTAVSVSGWSSTSVVVDGGPNAGQRAHGLGFYFEDLRRANGAQVTAQDQVVGIQVLSSNVDGAAFLIRDPGTNAGTDGDGTPHIDPVSPRAASPMELSFDGPWASETGDAPNPFLDYRLSVRFDGPGGRSLEVPGFFDADGRMGDVGNVWKVRFLPPTPGAWTATASMRSGTNVAISSNSNAGTPVTSIHGRTVQFTVGGIDAEEGGFYRLGTLRDVGKHHRKFEHGTHYLKAGANGPENFLALRAFQDVTKSGGEGNLHSFEPHRGDWRAGDPVLSPGADDDGKGVIGALNYLADEGVNSLFFLVMNLGGDGNDVYPFLGPRRRTFEKRHYDTSRLRQWNIVFEHAQRRGISLSLVLNETELENELWLDGGNLGVERKLYYREMVARFGHLPAIRWNLCEETDYTVAQLTDFAGWITGLDGDEHAIAIHNNPNDLGLFQSMLTNPDIDAASLQFDPNDADHQIEQVRLWTAQAGRPWTVDADEMGPWQTGLTATNANDIRKRVLYDALFSGGGVEFYLGWHELPLGGDLSLEDFRTRSEMWGYLGHARSFIEENLPFWDMDSLDNLLRNESSNYGGGEVFALQGEVYAIYYPRASNTGQLNLQGFTQNFELRWFNPRTGEFAGSTIDLGTGGGWRTIGSPPSSSSQDWVAFVRPQAPLWSAIDAGSVSQFDIQEVEFHAGSSFAGRNYVFLSSLSGTQNGFELGGLHIPINFDRWSRYGLLDTQGNVFENQIGTLDASGNAVIRVRLDPAFVSGLVGTTMYHCAFTTGPYDFVSNVVTLQVLP